jgi:hypothetical protein
MFDDTPEYNHSIYDLLRLSFFPTPFLSFFIKMPSKQGLNQGSKPNQKIQENDQPP